MELQGNAAISKTVFKFGDGSLSLDGTSTTYLGTDTASELYGLADEDFTLSLWVKWNEGTGTPSNEYNYLMDFRTNDSDTAPILLVNDNKQIEYYNNIAFVDEYDSDGVYVETVNEFSPIISAGSIADNNWHYVMLVRKGENTALYLDGFRIAAVNRSPENYFGSSRKFTVGKLFNGYIDDLHVVKGLALYDPTSTSIPVPTTQQGLLPQTSLLMTFPALVATQVPAVGLDNLEEEDDVASILANMTLIGSILGSTVVCGENGLVDQIKTAQTQMQQLIALGKNSMYAVQSKVDELKTFANAIKSGSDTPVATLQQDLLGILSVESLQNPDGAIADLLNLADKYQDARAEVEDVIALTRQFINDPINTPFDICRDTPNLQLFGDGVRKFAGNSLIPDPTLFPANLLTQALQEFNELLSITTGVSEEDLQTLPEQFLPTIPKFAIADIGSDRTIGGHLPAIEAYFPKPGQAHLAALNVASGKVKSILTSTRGLIAPKQTLANPFPDGKQYVAEDFYPSKYRKNIAQKINTLHPAVRYLFADGVQNYLRLNFEKGRDINVSEGYRHPTRSAELLAQGIRAAGPGKSWHNYGAAIDVAIYVNGKWDDGRRSVVEYVTFARDAFAPYGIINDLRGDSGHFYIRAFGKIVPLDLQLGLLTIYDLMRLNVVFDPEYLQGGGTGIYDPSFDPNFNPENDYFPPGYDPTNDPRSPVYNPPVDEDQPEPIDVGDPFDVRLIAIDAAGGETITEPTTPENPNPPPPPTYYVPSSGTIIGTGPSSGGGSGYSDVVIVVPGPIYPPAEPSVIQPIFRTNGTEHELFGRNFDLDPDTDVSTLAVSATGYDRTSLLGDVSAEPAPFGLDPTSFEYPGTTTLRVTRDGKVYVFSSTE